ncbi:hypothetical protein M8J77_000889 [Diaphorina citri]|nr:hypothetical protein M8J77_000889 [Diaphorina citri]
MNWSLHVDYVKTRAAAALNALKMVCNKNYGVRRAVLLTFYKSYILPIFDYGCIVYSSAKEYILKRLNAIHNSGIRIATGALISSPVCSLYVESGIAPLSLRRDKIIMRYMSKIGSCPSNPAHKELFLSNLDINVFPHNKPKPLCLRVRNMVDFMSFIVESEFVPYSRPRPPWSFVVPAIDFSLHCDNKSNISPLVFQKNFLDLMNSKYSDSVVCFSDGSKTANSTSCAYSIDKQVHSFNLNKVNSVFSAELMAILLCIKNLKFIPHNKFILISDSMSALQAISNLYSNNSLVPKIYSYWLDLKSCKNLSFLWCPSHCGIKGNESVDNAARNPNYNITLRKCTSDDFRPIISTIIIKNWQTSWNNITNNKLKNIKPKIEEWVSSNRDSRYEEIVITRLRIGHTRLTHEFLFNKTPRPSCSCGEPLSVQHLFSCPSHDQARSSLPSVPALINDPINIDSTLSYLKAIGLFTKI